MKRRISCRKAAGSTISVGQPTPRRARRPRRVERPEDLVVERAVRAEPVDEPFVVLQVARAGCAPSSAIGNAASAPSRRGAFDASARSVPDLALGIARAHEEHRLVLRVLGRQNEHGLGLVEAGQVEEVGVLPVLVLDVVVADRNRRRRKDRDAPPQAGHQLLAAFGESAHYRTG